MNRDNEEESRSVPKGFCEKLSKGFCEKLSKGFCEKLSESYYSQEAWEDAQKSLTRRVLT